MIVTLDALGSGRVHDVLYFSLLVGFIFGGLYLGTGVEFQIRVFKDPLETSIPPRK